MGRVGAGAYKFLMLQDQFRYRVSRACYKVGGDDLTQVADATDTDFWNMVHLSRP